MRELWVFAAAAIAALAVPAAAAPAARFADLTYVAKNPLRTPAGWFRRRIMRR